MLHMLEVMDKEPSLRAIWGAALLFGVAGYVATRLRRWLVFPALALVGVLAWMELGGLLDPQLGPAVMREAGIWYVAQAGGALALAVILCVPSVRSNTRLKLAAPSCCGSVLFVKSSSSRGSLGALR